MKEKNNQNLFNWLGALAVLIPIISWLFIFYSNSVVMAANVDDLQREKLYIRSSLEQIISRLAAIEGKVDEHSRNDRSSRTQK
jgi:amino acid permease